MPSGNARSKDVADQAGPHPTRRNYPAADCPIRSGGYLRCAQARANYRASGDDRLRRPGCVCASMAYGVRRRVGNQTQTKRNHRCVRVAAMIYHVGQRS